MWRSRHTGGRSGTSGLLVVAGGLCACLWGVSLWAAVPMVPRGKTIQVADRVWVIPDQRVSLVPNVGIVEGSRGVLVVDTGMGPANARIVLDEVRKLTDKRVLYLVCTHFHPEHNFGAQSFPPETVIVYSDAQRRELDEKGQAYRELFVKLFGQDVRELLEPVIITPPDVTFESEVQLNLGDRMVRLLHLGRPAHTRGDTLVYVPDAGVLFTGGLTVGRFFPIMADADSSGNGWIANLDEIEGLGLGIRTVVPDHGDISGPELLAVIRKYLVDLRTRVLELKGEKVPLPEIQERVFTEFSERYRDWGQPNWIRNAAEIFYKEDIPRG